MKRFIRRWLNESTPEDHTAATLDLVVRSARRCAYDLQHAVHMLDPKDFFYKEFEQRSQKWINLFQTGNSAKDYYIGIYSELQNAEDRVEKLKAELKKHGIPDPTLDDDCPF